MATVNRHIQDSGVKTVWVKRKLSNVCVCSKGVIAEVLGGGKVGRVVVLDCMNVEGVERNVSRKSCKVRERIEGYLKLTPRTKTSMNTVFYVRNGQCLMTSRDVHGVGEEGGKGADKEDEKLGYTTRIGGERWEDGKGLVKWFKNRVEGRGGRYGRLIIVMEIGVEVRTGKN